MSKKDMESNNQAEEMENVDVEMNNDKGAEVSTDESIVSDEIKEDEEEKSEPTLEEQMIEVQSKYLRLYADFENYRKRTNKEKVDLLSNASAGVVKEMIPVIDDFERAIANNENVEDPIALKEGFNLIYNKVKSILEAKGLKKMECKGELFDSEIHEAVANLPTDDEKLKGKVIDDVEKGYYMNDKVVRFAKVVVGQ